MEESKRSLCLCVLVPLRENKSKLQSTLEPTMDSAVLQSWRFGLIVAPEDTTMPDWFEMMEDRFWLHPDSVGEGEARFILKALHLRRGDTVLDAPCGAARVSFHLTRAGCIVTGIDLRDTFIRRARRRFRLRGLHGTFRVLDLRRLEIEGQFDGIFNWAGSFGYFSEAENVRLIAAYVRALRPGGRLLIEQPDREHLLRHFKRVMRTKSVIYRSRWDARNQRVITRRIEAGAEKRSNSSSMRLYTPAQMRALFECRGLIVEQMHRSLLFEAYGKSVPRMVIVGRKAETGASRPSSERKPAVSLIVRRSVKERGLGWMINENQSGNGAFIASAP
jgi:SAM-dependent methyltransferase